MFRTVAITLAFLAFVAARSGGAERPTESLSFAVPESALEVVHGDAKIEETGKRPVLALDASVSGIAAASVAFPWRERDVSVVEADVFLPTNAPGGSSLIFFAQDKDGIWFQAFPERPPRRGRWDTIRFTVGPRAGNMTPDGHDAVWNRYYNERMARVGFQFLARAGRNSVLRLGDVRFLRNVGDPSSPSIVHLHPPAGPVSAFALAEWSFDLSAEPGNPFDPDEIALDLLVRAPSDREFRIPCYYDQPHIRFLSPGNVEQVTPVGRASWKARFTPLEAGNHEWRIEVSGRMVASDQPVAVTEFRELAVRDAAPRGFPRPSASDPRHLETADGELFHPVGLNLHSPFDVRASQSLSMKLPPDRGTFLYDEYFPLMRENGMNAAAIWMATWWVAIEWNAGWKGYGGLNDYNLGNAWRLDQVFESALENGIQLLVCLDNHGKFRVGRGTEAEWVSSPYAKENGGPCETPNDFFVNEEAYSTYRKRLRYVVARWGAWPNLLGIVPVSEIDLSESGDHPTKTAWLVRVADELAALSPYGIMAGAHYSSNWPAVNRDAAAHPSLDFISGNAYTNGEGSVALYVATTREMEVFGKPYISMEYGRHVGGDKARMQMRGDLHTGLWATAVTPATGSPMLWWHDFVHVFQLWGDWRALARFMEGEDRRGSGWYTMTPDVRDLRLPGGMSEELAAVALCNGKEGAFWLYHKKYAIEWPIPIEDDEPPAASSLVPPSYPQLPMFVYEKPSGASPPASENIPSAVRLLGPACYLPGYLPGRYRVEYWDTLTGEIVHTEEATAGPEGVPVTPPPFWLDVAGKVKPVKAAEQQGGIG